MNKNIKDGPMLPANMAKLMQSGIPQRKAMSMALMQEGPGGKPKGGK